jgi:hypothetical protein
LNAEVNEKFRIHFSIQHSTFSIAVTQRKCTDIVRLLADFVEHHLPSAVHTELEKHLARCPRCVAQLKTYESTISLLRSVREEDLPQELRWTLKSFIEKNCGN